MYWNSDEVNLFLGKNKDVDKNHWTIIPRSGGYSRRAKLVPVTNLLCITRQWIPSCPSLLLCQPEKKLVKVSFVYCLLYFIWMNQFQFNLHIFFKFHVELLNISIIKWRRFCVNRFGERMIYRDFNIWSCNNLLIIRYFNLFVIY